MNGGWWPRTRDPAAELPDLATAVAERLGEDARVTGAQISRRAHNLLVEDYASVLLRSSTGVLGTVEVGNGFPRVGTDGEWKIAGRDAILTVKDNVMKLATAEGDEVTPGTGSEAPYYTTIRDALDWTQAEFGRISQACGGCLTIVLPGDTVSLLVSDAAFNNKQVGTGKPVTASGLSSSS